MKRIFIISMMCNCCSEFCRALNLCRHLFPKRLPACHQTFSSNDSRVRVTHWPRSCSLGCCGSTSSKTRIASHFKNWNTHKPKEKSRKIFISPKRREGRKSIFNQSHLDIVFFLVSLKKTFPLQENSRQKFPEVRKKNRVENFQLYALWNLKIKIQIFPFSSKFFFVSKFPFLEFLHFRLKKE